MAAKYSLQVPPCTSCSAAAHSVSLPEVFLSDFSHSDSFLGRVSCSAARCITYKHTSRGDCEVHFVFWQALLMLET